MKRLCAIWDWVRGCWPLWRDASVVALIRQERNLAHQRAMIAQKQHDAALLEHEKKIDAAIAKLNKIHVMIDREDRYLRLHLQIALDHQLLAVEKDEYRQYIARSLSRQVEQKLLHTQFLTVRDLPPHRPITNPHGFYPYPDDRF